MFDFFCSHIHLHLSQNKRLQPLFKLVFQETKHTKTTLCIYIKLQNNKSIVAHLGDIMVWFGIAVWSLQLLPLYLTTWNLNIFHHNSSFNLTKQRQQRHLEFNVYFCQYFVVFLMYDSSICALRLQSYTQHQMLLSESAAHTCSHNWGKKWQQRKRLWRLPTVPKIIPDHSNLRCLSDIAIKKISYIIISQARQSASAPWEAFAYYFVFQYQNTSR